VRQDFNYKYNISKSELNFKLIKTNVLPTENPFTDAYLNPTHIQDLSINYLKDFNVTSTNYKYTDSEICFFVNDYRDVENKVSSDLNFMVLKMSESIRFKIKSKKMQRTIEIFKTKSNDFFSTVARFHLPLVRAYYTGNNVYMLPSCITAMMTGINIEYKYFAGIRDPVEIINKYISRGFGILLSKDELKYLEEYNTLENVGAFKISKEHPKLFGGKDMNDEIFKPLVYSQGLPKDIYNSTKLKYLKSYADVLKVYETKYKYSSTDGIDILKFRAITQNGNIREYSSSIVEMYYNVVNSN